MTGSEVVMRILERNGVEVIFGHPGGAIMPIYDALYDSPIEHILVRHEQAGVHMADAYYRASGKVGVCFGTSGPGATNMVTGLATAMMDSSAVVAITGNVPSGLIGTDAFQEADVFGITGPVTKHNFLVKDVAELPRVMAEAFHIATTGRPGPVLVDITKDVQQAAFEGSLDVEIDLPGYHPYIELSDDEVAAAATAVREAKQPVMIIGGGSQGAVDEVGAFVEGTGIPVITTLMGIGAFPPGHAQNLGMPGMHGTVTANKAISNCDLILAAGMRFDDRVTGKISRFAPNAKIVHIDIDAAEISKLVKAHVPVHGDVKMALPAMLERLQESGGGNAHLEIDEWRGTVYAWKAQYPEKYEKGKALASQEILEMLRGLTDSGSIVATEVGQHQMFAARLFPPKNPRSFITSGGLGTMGFGFPAAIGAARARPGETVVCIAGDGSVQMNIQELATLYKLQLPVVIVILNNGVLGMVRQWQELFHAQRYSEIYLADSNPDFAKVAEAYGIEGHNIFEREQAEAALKNALAAKKPVLLNVYVYEAEKVFPMVPAGAGVDQMILGDQAPEEEAEAVKA